MTDRREGMIEGGNGVDDVVALTETDLSIPDLAWTTVSVSGSAMSGSGCVDSPVRRLSSLTKPAVALLATLALVGSAAWAYSPGVPADVQSGGILDGDALDGGAALVRDVLSEESGGNRHTLLNLDGLALNINAMAAEARALGGALPLVRVAALTSPVRREPYVPQIRTSLSHDEDDGAYVTALVDRLIDYVESRPKAQVVPAATIEDEDGFRPKPCPLLDMDCQAFTDTLPEGVSGGPPLSGGERVLVRMGKKEYELTDWEAERFRRCLVIVALGESRGEPAIGQLAVMHTVLNRTMADGFGSDPCAVVTERNQFEAMTDPRYVQEALRMANGQMPQWPRVGEVDEERFRTLRLMAWHLTTSGLPDPTNGALYFWAPVAQKALGRKPPSWSRKFVQTASIGGHIFYTDRQRSSDEE